MLLLSLRDSTILAFVTIAFSQYIYTLGVCSIYMLFRSRVFALAYIMKSTDYKLNYKAMPFYLAIKVPTPVDSQGSGQLPTVHDHNPESRSGFTPSFTPGISQCSVPSALPETDIPHGMCSVACDGMAALWHGK